MEISPPLSRRDVTFDTVADVIVVEPFVVWPLATVRAVPERIVVEPLLVTPLATVRAVPERIVVEPLLVTPLVTERESELLMTSLSAASDTVALLFKVMEVGLATPTMNESAGMPVPEIVSLMSVAALKCPAEAVTVAEPLVVTAPVTSHAAPSCH